MLVIEQELTAVAAAARTKRNTDTSITTSGVAARKICTWDSKSMLPHAATTQVQSNPLR